MKTIAIIVVLLFSINSFAQNAVKLNMGDIAPFKGVLLTPERAEKALKAEKKNIVLEDLRITQDELIQYHKDSAKQARNKLSEAKFNAFLTNSGYFFLGVILGSLAIRIGGDIQDLR